jgi:hypothetical protein
LLRLAFDAVDNAIYAPIVKVSSYETGYCGFHQQYSLLGEL